MTRAEAAAFNQGVAAAVDLAERSAVALQAKLVDKPTRYSFAIEALKAVAEGSLALMVPDEQQAGQGARQATE